MITSIKKEGDLYLLTNKISNGYSCTGTMDSDFYKYDIIVCETTEKVKDNLSKWGYEPEEASHSPYHKSLCQTDIDIYNYVNFMGSRRMI